MHDLLDDVCFHSVPFDEECNICEAEFSASEEGDPDFSDGDDDDDVDYGDDDDSEEEDDEEDEDDTEPNDGEEDND